jgi:hypothetical protein
VKRTRKHCLMSCKLYNKSKEASSQLQKLQSCTTFKIELLLLFGLKFVNFNTDDNLYCKINDITPETAQHWEDMKIRCPRAKIQPKI